MAIYLDNKILKADPKGNKLEREYAAGLEKVNELFDKFRRKGESTSYLQIARNTDERIVSITSHKTKRLPPIALPVEVPHYDDEMGATLIRYSTTPPMKNPNGNFTWSTKYLDLREIMTITDKQKDLAWFLLFASNLIKKGIYQLVDVQAKYEGTFNEIMAKKQVIDELSIDEDLLKLVASTFISEGMIKLEPKELFVKVINWLEISKKWNEVIAVIRNQGNTKVLVKESISGIEWDNEPVVMRKCPTDVIYKSLKDEATELEIPLTVPPQTKDVLYSLIQHVKEKKQIEVLNE